MKEQDKTEQQLLAKLTEMQRRIAGLETKLRRAEEALRESEER